MFEIDNCVLNADILLERVRKNVLMIKHELDISEGNSSSIGHFDISQIQEELDSVFENIQIMNKTWNYRCTNIVSNRKVVAPIVVFLKRAIRKTIYWFTQPFFEQQTVFNGAITRAISNSLKVQEQIINTLNKSNCNCEKDR